MVVVYRYIIMPLRGPTCKMVLARIQFPLNSKLDPSVAKSAKKGKLGAEAVTGFMQNTKR